MVKLVDPSNLQDFLDGTVYLLMKNNKDSFKNEDLDKNIDLNVSTLHSVIQGTKLNTSQLC